MKIQVFILNSFAKTLNGGNPAGVVLNSDGLSEKEMLLISKEIGLAETAFVQKSKIADFKVMFFTPSSEVDLCGHATIATFSLLKQLNIIKEGYYFQETKAGRLRVSVDDKNNIFMNQNLPQYYETLNRDEICGCLGLEPCDFEDLPIQVVSTGLRDIIVPIKNNEKLLSITPNYDEIIKISQKYDVIGIHAFRLNNKDSIKAYCRNFAPLYDVPEESATGTSNGALSCFLYKYAQLKPEECDLIKIEQGYSLNKPSEIYIKLNIENDKIIEVQVGGIAIMSYKREINI